MLVNLPRFLIENLDVFSSFTEALNSTLNVGKGNRKKSAYVGKEKRQKSTYLTFWTAKGLFKVLLINSFEFFHGYNNLSFG